MGLFGPVGSLAILTSGGPTLVALNRTYPLNQGIAATNRATRNHRRGGNIAYAHRLVDPAPVGSEWGTQEIKRRTQNRTGPRRINVIEVHSLAHLPRKPLDIPGTTQRCNRKRGFRLMQSLVSLQ